MQKKAAYWGAALSLLVLLSIAIAACNSSDNESAGAACSVDSECAGGEVCKWERCLPFCVTADDCQPDAYCHGAGVCTECAFDENCAEGNYCIDGVCVAEHDVTTGKSCKNDFECGDGQICYNSKECRLTCQVDLDCESPHRHCNNDGVCAICIEDAHCLAGQTCENEKCVGTPTDGDSDGEAAEPEEEVVNNEPDGWPGDECGTDLPQCRTPTVCTSFGEASFCTHECSSSSECYFDIEGGCCLKIDDTQSICAPFDYCPDIGIDGRPCTAAEACLEDGLRCLKDGHGTNFCSRNCTKDSDCPAGSYPDGCCRQIEGSGSWCVPGEFCN